MTKPDLKNRLHKRLDAILKSLRKKAKPLTMEEIKLGVERGGTPEQLNAALNVSQKDLEMVEESAEALVFITAEEITRYAKLLIPEQEMRTAALCRDMVTDRWPWPDEKLHPAGGSLGRITWLDHARRPPQNVERDLTPLSGDQAGEVIIALSHYHQHYKGGAPPFFGINSYWPGEVAPLDVAHWAQEAMNKAIKDRGDGLVYLAKQGRPLYTLDTMKTGTKERYHAVGLALLFLAWRAMQEEWQRFDTIPSSYAYRAAQRFASDPTVWSKNDAGYPVTKFKGGGVNGWAQLVPGGNDIDDITLMSPNDRTRWASVMWEQSRNLNDIQSDVLDILSANYADLARHTNDAVTIGIDDMLKWRGLKPKKGGRGNRGGYRPDQRAAVMAAMSNLSSLWMHVDISAWGTRGKKNYVYSSRAMSITDKLGQYGLDGSIDVHVIKYTIGDAFKACLFGSGRQVALLSRKVPQYDPYRQPWEKRLARYLLWQWRIKIPSGEPEPYTYRISTLLSEARQEVDGKNPTRTRDRLEKALDTIQNDQIIRNWEYDPSSWNENWASQRGWRKRWLKAKIEIKPPKFILGHYKSIKEQRHPQQKALSTPASLGGRLKQARKDRGINQALAAKEIGVNQATLSRIERGKGNLPRKATLAKIEAWISG